MTNKVPPAGIDITLRSGLDGSKMAVTLDQELSVTSRYRALIAEGDLEKAQQLVESVAEKVKIALERKEIDLAENLVRRELNPLKDLIENTADRKYINLLIDNFRLRIEKALMEEKAADQQLLPTSLEAALVKPRPKFAFENDGRFEAIAEIGAGGMGRVFEVLDHDRGTAPFALKLLDITARAADDMLNLKNEFRELRRLNHPNLVRYHELFDKSGLCYFTMDKIDGTDFLSYLSPRHVTFRSNGVDPKKHSIPGDISNSDTISVKDLNGGVNLPPVDLDKLQKCIVQLVKGLNYMHQKGVIHRDIKPANVLVKPNGDLVLIDFGLVRKFDTDDLVKSASVSLKGTPLYMAPEQISDPGNIGPAADWYAMGVMLYELLVGEPPFTDANFYVLFEQKNKILPKEPHLLNPGIPLVYSELCMDLLQQDPNKRPKGAEILKRISARQEVLLADSTNSVSLPSVQSLFVGREGELKFLENAVDQVGKGEAVTVMTVGNSGVGKSKFVREFANRQKLADSTVMLLSGVCYEQENVVFKALGGVMDAVSQILNKMSDQKASLYLPKDTDLLARVFPVLKRIPVIANFPFNKREYEPQESKKRLFKAVREFFERIAMDHRLIMVIDDLQWADKDSVELLRYVLNPPEVPNLLLLLTSREHPDKADLSLPGDFRVLSINELEKGSAEKLVSKIFQQSGKVCPPKTIDMIVAETGSPYYLQELARHVLTSGDVSVESKVSLDEALRSRIEKLNAVEQKLLVKVCSLGRPLPQQILFQSGTSDWNLDEFLRLVSNLRDEQLIRTNGLKLNYLIEPFHDRVRETVLAMVDEDPQEKIKVHEDLAKALQTSPQPDLQALASHWEQAGDLDKAYEYALKTAIQADQALAFETATKFYLKTISLGDSLDAFKKSFLYEKYGDALDNLGRGKEAADAYISACEGVEDVDRLKNKAAGVLLRSGQIELGLKTLGAVLEANGLKLYESRVLIVLVFIWARLLLKFRGLKFKAVEEKEIPKNQLSKIDLYWNVSSGLALLKPIQANIYNTKMLHESLQAGELERIMRGLLMESIFSSCGGSKNQERTEEIIDSIKDVDGKLATPKSKMLLKMSQCGNAYLSGSFSKSDYFYNEIQKLSQETRIEVWIKNNVFLFHLWTQYWLGQYKYLSSYAPELVADVDKKGDKYASISFKLGFPSMYYLAKDKPEEMMAINKKSLFEWPGDAVIQSYSSDKGIIHGHLYQGNGEEAFNLINKQIHTLKKAKLLTMFQVIRMECYHMMARSAVLVGSKDKLKKAEKSVKAMLNEDIPFSNALAKLVLAAIWFQRNDKVQAIKLLEECNKTFGELKMSSFEASSKYQLGKLIGGEKGQNLIDQAYLWADFQEIVCPEKIFNMDAPGFNL